MRTLLAFVLVVSLIAVLLIFQGCATAPGTDVAKAQAEFDQACKYANGVISAAEPVIPIAQGMILAKFGEDAGAVFMGALQTITTVCGEPLDLANAGAVVQRIYDAGGQIVALIVKSQET